eukprot:6183452-Pleurochrysis_carterae.AAC.4
MMLRLTGANKRIRAWGYKRDKRTFKVRGTGRASMPEKSARASAVLRRRGACKCGIAELEYGHPLDPKVIITQT